MILKFNITPSESNHPIVKRIEIKWDFPLKKGGEVQREMKRTLEELHGVEFVDCQRYTAYVGFAEHVVKVADLAEDIAITLEENRELIYLYNKHEAKPTYGAAERIEVESNLL